LDLSHIIEQESRFELLPPVSFNHICSRFTPQGVNDNEKLNTINQSLLEELNGK